LQNFTVSDISGSLAAVCIFPLFVVAPGYAVAWLLDLFDFRRRTAPFRLALALPLSIAIVPIVAYLAGRYAGMPVVWGLLAVAWLYVIFAIARFGPGPWPAEPKNGRLFLLAAIWVAIAIFSLCDLQIGNKLYYSTIALDYSVRTQFIHAISAGGIPPANPFFYPGQPAPLRYHYFWLIPCSLVNVAGGRLVSAREAWIGGAVWCGLGLMAVVALFFRLFAYHGEATFRRRTMLGILLLGVTGLDIVPNALLWFMYSKGLADTILPTVEWWNEQIDGFTWTALWEAHHLAGLLSVLIAFLLLSEAPRREGGTRWTYAIAAGVALASSFGDSIYIGFVFGVFLLAWTGVTLLKKWRAETGVLIVAGAVCLMLAAPYLASMAGGPSSAGSGAFPFTFDVRRFFLIDRLLKAQGHGEWWRLTIVNTVLLPLNYLLELGFFLGAGIIWWRKRRDRAEPLSRNELAAVLMILTSAAICTFLRSTVIDNNDLGWRGFLVAQFGLLLWAVDIAGDWKRRGNAALAAMLAIGAAGTAYDLFMLRAYPVLADRGALPHLIWMSQDRRLGERNYAVREAYEWAHRSMPAGAVLQFDPHVVWQDTPGFLYSGRQIAAADEQCLAGFGGEQRRCGPLMTVVRKLYPDKGGVAADSMSVPCNSLPASIVVAKDTDSVWKARDSWVWREKPVFANDYIRVFACDNGAMKTAAAR
jgi:hypothetical protein